MITSFRELEVYKEGYELALIVYKLTRTFPRGDYFELGGQIRRAAFSIPANIAEGWGKRRFSKEVKHYLDVAIGSASEMEVHLDASRDLGFINAAEANDLIQRYQHLQGKLVNLRNNWK